VTLSERLRAYTPRLDCFECCGRGWTLADRADWMEDCDRCDGTGEEPRR
jgi:hypothetical protein